MEPKYPLYVNPNLVSNFQKSFIDYHKVMQQFGCSPLSLDFIHRISTITNKPIHPLLKRGIFYAHRDFDKILDVFQSHKNNRIAPFYLYTGRGPSSKSLHLGHMLPFIMNKYLQEMFDVPLIIQITDDEKYFYHQGSQDLQSFRKMSIQNIKDIISLGFDPEKTFIFINSQYMGNLYPNVVKFQKHINLNTLKAIFGDNFADNSGKVSFPAIQAAPCLSSSFPHIFGNQNIPCLIPCGIDQDPYFRMTRDVCGRLKVPKPAGLYSQFFPSLQGVWQKMSASVPNSSIYLSDTKEEIERKIKKYAYSGGKGTKEDQGKYGADLEIDVSFTYLKFLMEDEKQLLQIGEKYKSGKMLTSQIKQILTKVVQETIAKHSQRRKGITDQDVLRFLSTQGRKFIFRR